MRDVYSDESEAVTIGVVTGNYDDSAGCPSLVSIRSSPTASRPPPAPTEYPVSTTRSTP